MSKILLSGPDITELEEQYLVRALRSGWVAPLGPDVDAFETEMCQRVGVDYAVALSSGTAALHLALVSWGVGPGDVIPTSTLTFAATANAICYTGATPYFIDCDPKTGNIDPVLLDEVLTVLHSEGASVPAIVPVDLLGKCADYTAISQIASRHKVKILSDAAESLGSKHGDIPAGAFGDAAVLSFNGNKIMTTSGAGMLLTNDQALAEHVRFLSTQAREPETHYEHKEIGYNYRMSNLLAAVGRAQLERLDDMIAARRAHREAYADLFADVDGIEIFQRDGDEDDNCWLTAVLVDNIRAGWAPSDLAAHLANHDIETRPVWKPMHLQPLHADKPARTTGASQKHFENGLSLPSGSAINADQHQKVLARITDFVAAA